MPSLVSICSFKNHINTNQNNEFNTSGVLRINVYGRCVYNSVSRLVYEKDDLFWSEDNRITKRCVFKEVKNIQEAIEFKVWVDKSIMEEISYYRNAETSNIISSQTYNGTQKLDY